MSDHHPPKQGRMRSACRSVFVLLILLCAFGLAACGKKASHLDPPDGVVDDTFPQTYPNPDMEPKPTLNPLSNPTIRIAPTLAAPISTSVPTAAH